ncbi:pimeloyl-ACP methyl ester carboxylesterase [Micromonospora kangleipakensis]|uniref:Pimeloyl-ACP methyl ester carboxylesterase n=1 Tax=Micromonospora kangleipakensis TaxID=1077942 RepID=A0A4Q8BJW5_9ACTN|nr:alpha/beta hydrolase [Micromonospora kangleipakensis]RZU77743.1 pimeloyl-ACP methyl ester carboxylesterase [Micromonospora kangleipakensis]
MTLAHDVAGSGPTVLLLHSTACDRRMWDPQVPALVDAGCRVVRSDMRGYGDSPVPDGPYNNAEDVIELLDLLGAEEFALVGSSGGGRVALEIAARWPRRVTSLVLLCTALAGHEPSAELQAFGEREDALLEAGDVTGATDLNVDTLVGPHADQAAREQVREMQRHAFEVQLAAVEEFPQLRPEFDLADITAPTLVISGDHDLPDFRQIAVRLSKELADARHLQLDWAGHLPSLERPEVVNPLLLDFLRETHAGGGRGRQG